MRVGFRLTSTCTAERRLRGRRRLARAVGRHAVRAPLGAGAGVRGAPGAVRAHAAGGSGRRARRRHRHARRAGAQATEGSVTCHALTPSDLVKS